MKRAIALSVAAVLLVLGVVVAPRPHVGSASGDTTSTPSWVYPQDVRPPAPSPTPNTAPTLSRTSAQTQGPGFGPGWSSATALPPLFPFELAECQLRAGYPSTFGTDAGGNHYIPSLGVVGSTQYGPLIEILWFVECLQQPSTSMIVSQRATLSSWAVSHWMPVPLQGYTKWDIAGWTSGPTTEYHQWTAGPQFIPCHPVTYYVEFHVSYEQDVLATSPLGVASDVDKDNSATAELHCQAY